MAISNFPLLFVLLLTSFVSPTIAGFWLGGLGAKVESVEDSSRKLGQVPPGIYHLTDLRPFSAILQQPPVSFPAPIRSLEDLTKATPLQQAETDSGSRRRLQDDDNTTSQEVTLTIRGEGAEEKACTDCALGIYDTSSCDKQDITDADPVYDETKLVDNPWVNATYTIDENGDIDYEVKFDHGVAFEDYLNKAIVLFGSAGNPVGCGVFNLLNETCADSGGTVTVTNCSCTETRSFPETCGVGACTCPPGDEPNEIGVCECPQDACFDGVECVSVEAPTDAPVDAPTDAPTSEGFLVAHFLPALAVSIVMGVIGYYY